MAEHYVYMYLADDIPYYIGMGKGNRMTAYHLYVDVPALTEIAVIRSSMTKEDAWDLETKLVDHYGLACNNTGILKNLRRGGKTSNSDWYHSEQAKEKISAGNKGKVRTEAHKKNYRKPKTAEHAEKIRQANLGRKPDGRYAKASATLKGKPWSQARRDAQNMKKQLKVTTNDVA